MVDGDRAQLVRAREALADLWAAERRLVSESDLAANADEE
jgi:hypothetical protein